MSDAGVRRSAVLLFSIGQQDAVEVSNTWARKKYKKSVPT